MLVGYTPGVIGRVAELHGRYYARHWGFGSFFEAKVATELSAFINGYNESRDCIWSLFTGKTIEGTISVDGGVNGGNVAHLRWFIISDWLRGHGAGNRLLAQAMAFCEERGFDMVYLWTFQGLDAARHLYEKYGFKLVETRSGTQWGKRVVEQRFEHFFHES
jgi:ribosomal protein S18 acetylase RimI-like enzyme